MSGLNSLFNLLHAVNMENTSLIVLGIFVLAEINVPLYRLKRPCWLKNTSVFGERCTCIWVDLRKIYADLCHQGIVSQGTSSAAV